MKKIVFACCVFFAMLGLSCERRSVTAQEVSDNIQQRFVPEFGLLIEGTDEGHVFTLTTNLPDGTTLFATMHCEAGEPRWLWTSGFAAVSDGTVVFGPARSQGGKFALEVVMSSVAMQDEAVRNVLGHNGENIDSPFLVRSEFFDTITLEKRFAIEL